MITHFSFGQNWTEDFESTPSTTYGAADITISGRVWTKYEAGNFSYANTHAGSYGFTINDDKANAHITTPSLNTCGTVSFKYAYIYGSPSNVFQFQVSTDGSNFSTLDTHTLGASSNVNYTDYSYNVNNLSSTVYIRILSDDQNAHLFIDDFSVTNFASSDPTVTFDATTSTVNETDIDIVTTGIPVTFSNYTADATITPTVNASSTADAADYTIDLTPLTFSADGTLNIPLTIKDDADFLDETIIIDFTVTSGTADLELSQHTVTITDDELPPSIGFDTATSAETETDATFNVTIPVTVSSYSGTQIDVSVVASGTAESGDFTLNTASLSFTADGSQNISLDINDDADTDEETVILTITETSAVTGLVISQNTHTVTITDDEAPVFMVEDFTNSNATASYSDNSFTGNNSITWSYVASRNENADANGAGIDGNALMLRRVSSDSKITSNSISGGIGDFSVKLYKGFTGGGDRQVELFINGVTKGTSTVFDDNIEHIFTINGINVTGDVIIELKNTTSYQIIVDDISWTSYSTTVTWDGSDSSDWATPANWDTNAIPIATDNVIIPDVTTAPIIGATTGALTNDLTITETDGINITAGGSLIVSGTSSGTVTFNRTIPTDNWYLISSPVAGETYDDAYVTANSIASGTQNPNSRGIAPFVTTDDSWDYMQAGETTSFSTGTGYSVKRTSTGDVSFTGTINVDDAGIDVVLSSAGNRFNLLGNPYTSHIASATFLTGEAAISETKNLWVWNQGTGTSGAYEVKTVPDAMVIAPAQGFFVQANEAGGTFNFTESNQASNGGTFQRTDTRPEIYLTISDQTDAREAKIYYIENMTSGFDVGYEGGLFNGVSNPLAIYTHLVADSEGKNYQVQSLPTNNYENMIIPVGINAVSGIAISIDASTNNFPDGINIYLEDKQDNSFTLLDADSSFNTTLENDLSGIGRFYLYTTAGTLSTDALEIHNNVSIYKTSNDNLRIVGVQNGTASIQIYNILGKQMMRTSFEGMGVNDISLPTLTNGVYIIKLATKTGTTNKKIIIQ